MINTNLVDFCSYIQPILNSCLGFIKTDGYFTHVPGAIYAMSADETVFASIKIPVIYDVYITSVIGRFLQLKTPEEQSDLMNNIYFTGWNIKGNSLIRYNSIYSQTDMAPCIYEEPDCLNIPTFDQAVSSTSISSINVSDGIYNYSIPASKAITTLTKSDHVGLKLYSCAFDPLQIGIKTARYTLFKKKFKINVDIFMNILMA